MEQRKKCYGHPLENPPMAFFTGKKLPTPIAMLEYAEFHNYRRVNAIRLSAGRTFKNGKSW